MEMCIPVIFTHWTLIALAIIIGTNMLRYRAIRQPGNLCHVLGNYPRSAKAVFFFLCAGEGVSGTGYGRPGQRSMKIGIAQVTGDFFRNAWEV